jgi:MoxR-like ATPase
MPQFPDHDAPDAAATPALIWAARAHAALSPRMPEGVALATWFNQSSSQESPEEIIDLFPTPFPTASPPRVTAAGWQRLGRALRKEEVRPQTLPERAAHAWGAALTRRLALDPLDSAILALALHYVSHQRFERLFDMLSQSRGGPTQFHRSPWLLGLLLGVAPEQIERRLAPEAKLLTSGLLHPGKSGDLSLPQRLAALVRAGVAPAGDIYDQLLGAPASAALPWAAFAHLGREGEIAAALLANALAGREKGVHLLLYGPPGTGKTAFAKALAAHLATPLRLITESNDDEGEPDRDDRLAGLRLANRLATPGDMLLLFDEAEDLFAPRHDPFEKRRAGSRVFIHRLLEEMAVPMIWTANDVHALGAPVLRRMTMCLEVKTPRLAARTRLWREIGESAGVTLAEADAAHLARLVPVAPALAASALRAAKLAGGGAETARLVASGVAHAISGRHAPAAELEPPEIYDPALVNADTDLLALADRLAAPGAPRAVSLLLAGPPGAGKTAWARHLAARLELPVLQKRASDILDPYVGGTERAIAEAFAEAREMAAFLLFDEADSLLFERGDAVRSWEISQVNEMLAAMAAHDFPFACTTNLAERLDRACLRRFLLKIRFEWMTPAQTRAAFRRFFACEPPRTLEALRCLTPADFALVARRAALSGAVGDAAALVQLLATETAGRRGGRGPLGFASSAAA